VEEDDAGDGIRMNLLVFYFCSTRKDACRQRDPEAAMVAILRRKRSIFPGIYRSNQVQPLLELVLAGFSSGSRPVSGQNMESRISYSLSVLRSSC
jgi:hypothetical protein